MKVKIIEAEYKWILEHDVNKFLDEKGEQIYDIKYATCVDELFHQYYSAMIILK